MSRFSGRYTAARHDEAIENVPEEFRGDVVNVLNFLEARIERSETSETELAARVAELEQQNTDLKIRLEELEDPA